jgi:putative phosphoesterase/HAD superfamily hydrolase (TIGR01509 family)
MIKAVIFDLDGVIADTEHLSEQADVIVLSRYGIKMTDEEKMLAFGRRMEEIFYDILQARKSKLDIKKLIREKDKVFTKLIKGNLDPIKGSLELVDFFKKSGFKLALATSSHTDKMKPEIQELDIEDLFKVKITGDDVSKGKPNPEIFLLAAKKLGVKPSECAVVEDSAFGVQAAKNAGMLAIGFKSPNSAGQDLSKADIITDNLDLVKIHFHRRGIKEKIRVAAVSNTHLGLKDEVPEKIKKALRGVDLILHTGDILDLSVIRKLGKIAPIRAVHGDSDPNSVKEELPGLGFVHIFKWKIGMVHNASLFGTKRALSMAKRNNCDVLVYGHSHKPSVKMKDGIWLVNSGSPTMPLLAWLIKPTIALLEISKSEIKPRLVRV